MRSRAASGDLGGRRGGGPAGHLTRDGSSVVEVAGTSLMRALAEAGRFDEACDVYEEIDGAAASAAQPLSSITHTVRIDVLGRAGRLDAALAALADMEGAGVGSNAATLNVLCKWLGRGGRGPEALRLFRRLSAQGVVPDTVSYNTLLEAVVFGKDPKAAHRELVAAALSPAGPPSAAEAAAAARLRSGVRADAAVAWELVGEMELRGAEPNRWTLNTLLHLSLREATAALAVARAAAGAAAAAAAAGDGDTALQAAVLARTGRAGAALAAQGALHLLSFGRRRRMQASAFTYNLAALVATAAKATEGESAAADAAAGRAGEGKDGAAGGEAAAAAAAAPGAPEALCVAEWMASDGVRPNAETIAWVQHCVAAAGAEGPGPLGEEAMARRWRQVGALSNLLSNLRAAGAVAAQASLEPVDDSLCGWARAKIAVAGIDGSDGAAERYEPQVENLAAQLRLVCTVT